MTVTIDVSDLSEEDQNILDQLQDVMGKEIRKMNHQNYKAQTDKFLEMIKKANHIISSINTQHVGESNLLIHARKASNYHKGRYLSERLENSKCKKGNYKINLKL